MKKESKDQKKKQNPVTRKIIWSRRTRTKLNPSSRNGLKRNKRWNEQQKQRPRARTKLPVPEGKERQKQPNLRQSN